MKTLTNATIDKVVRHRVVLLAALRDAENAIRFGSDMDTALNILLAAREKTKL